MFGPRKGPLFDDRVARARAMPPEEKLLAGARLFEYACEITIAGIRNKFPSADEQQVQDILFKRLRLRRKLDRQQLTSPHLRLVRSARNA